MKLYTKGGDKGQTGLFGGARLSKDHDRVVAYGDVDEVNAAIGLAAAGCADSDLLGRLHHLQSDLFVIGSQLASEDAANLPERIAQDAITRLEQWIDAAAEEAGPLKTFILPGGTDLSARLHLARTICRRAERGAVRLSRELPVDPQIVVYLNRLSDLLFALARVANRRAGVKDVAWPLR